MWEVKLNEIGFPGKSHTGIWMKLMFILIAYYCAIYIVCMGDGGNEYYSILCFGYKIKLVQESNIDYYL